MSTRYAILNNIDKENSFIFNRNNTKEKIANSYVLIFDTNKTEEEMEKVVNSYVSGSGNNFQFDGNYFKDPATIENDFIVIKQMTVESPNFYVLYQFIFNSNDKSRRDLLDYNFNIPKDDISDVVDKAFGIIREQITSNPISFEYDFKFCEGGSN